jgi:peptidoglycan/LPS O-acetylase OafA/YrhL
LEHRTDLQGLRAVAVLVVLLEHAGVSFAQGGYVGVDVFFVLSGFLITGLLVSRVERNGRVALADFYVRRARRILPAAVLVLIVTVVASYLLLNFVRTRSVVTDSLWAACFVVNVHFAHEGTDYFASWQPPSPLLHYWTLSVEEQFYLVWPILLSIFAVGRIPSWSTSGRSSHSTIPAPSTLRRRIAVLAIVIGSASLLWSIFYTPRNPTEAYFSTLTRAWELALGAMLAVAVPWLSAIGIPAAVRAFASIIGLVAIGVSVVTYSTSTIFPGFAALLPTLGAAAVIAAGIGGRARIADHVLSNRLMTYVGDRSYTIYLWHWPVLIIGGQYIEQQYGRGSDSVALNMVLIGIAIAISIVTYALFENPLRKLSWPVPRGVLAWPVSVVIVMAVGVSILGAIDSKAARLESAAASPTRLRAPSAPHASRSATAVRPLPAVTAAVNAARRNAPLPEPLTPPPSKLLEDQYYFPEGCTPDRGETKSNVCRLGDESARKTIVVLGDSFAQHWMPSILEMATQDGWTVVPLVNGSGCASGAWLRYPSRPWCPKWYRWALGQAASLHPDVTLIGGEWGPDTPPEAPVGAKHAIRAAKKFSRDVIVLSVPPFQTRQPVDCVLAKGATMKTCTSIASPTSLAFDDQVTSFAKSQRVGVMNTRGWFCQLLRGRYWCPLVITQTITRPDLGHVTATYATQLALPFRTSFRAQLFR